MLHVDRLPDDREFVVVERRRILEQVVKMLVAVEQGRGFGHHGVEARHAAEGFVRVFEQRAAVFRRGIEGVKGEVGHI